MRAILWQLWILLLLTRMQNLNLIQPMSRIYGGGNVMDMENTKDFITDGEKSVIPPVKSEMADASTSLENKTSPNASGVATTAKELPEKRGQLPQLPQLPQQENTSIRPPEAQGWMGILWQSLKNLDSAGVSTFITTKWKNDVPMLVIMAYPGFCCDSCHKFNYGTSCQNEDCPNLGVEIEQPKWDSFASHK